MKSASTNQQLRLVDPARSWRIDARTREIGRVGVQRARLELQRSLPAVSDDSEHQDDSQAA